MDFVCRILERILTWIMGYGGSTVVGLETDTSIEANNQQCSKKHVTELIDKFEKDVACIENKFKQADEESSKKPVDELIDDLNTSIDRKTK